MKTLAYVVLILTILTASCAVMVADRDVAGAAAAATE